MEMKLRTYSITRADDGTHYLHGIVAPENADIDDPERAEPEQYVEFKIPVAVDESVPIGRSLQVGLSELAAVFRAAYEEAWRP